MKTKTTNKDQLTNNQKVKKTESKNNGKYNTYHGPLSQKWIDGRYRSLILYDILIQVMNNLLTGFGAVLESIRNNPYANCIE